MSADTRLFGGPVVPAPAAMPVLGDRLICCRCQHLVDDLEDVGDGTLICADCLAALIRNVRCIACSEPPGMPSELGCGICGAPVTDGPGA